MFSSAVAAGQKNVGLRRRRRPSLPALSLIENLEQRTLLTTELTLSGGMLVVTDISALGQSDTLTITSDTTNSKYVISDPNQTFIVTGIAGAVVSGDLHSVDVPFAAVTASEIIVNTLGGDDTVTAVAIGSEFHAGLAINGGAGTDAVNLNTSLTFASGEGLRVTAETFTVGAAANIVMAGEDNISIAADTVTLNATSTLVSPGSVSIAQQTPGRAITLGQKNPGELGLSFAEINRITAGTLVFGDDQSGGLQVTSGGLTPVGTSTVRMNSGTFIGVSSITVDNLAMSAGQGIIYSGDVKNLAAYTASSGIFISDANGLTVTSVAGVDGLVKEPNSGNGSISIDLASGNLSVLNTPATDDITGQGISITLASGAVFSTASGSVVHSTGGALYTITADEMALLGALQGEGGVRLQPRTAGVQIVLGTNPGTANTLELSAAEIALMEMQGTMIIGRNDASAAGDITITGAITTTAGLRLETSGAVIDGNSSGVDLTAPSVVMRTGTGVGSAGVNQTIETSTIELGVENLISGDVLVANTGNVVLNSGNPAGLKNNGGSLSIINDGWIAALLPITVAGSGDLTLDAQGATSYVRVQADLTAGAGDITLRADGNVETLGTTGSLKTTTGNMFLYADDDASGLGTVNFNLPINLGSGTATVNLPSEGGTLGGIISGTGNLIKSGTGTLILSATNNYTGTTAVNAGMLQINGSITSNTTVASGATLGGTGTINSANSLTVLGGGSVAPGASPGVLHAGSVSFASGSTFNVEIAGTLQAGLQDQLDTTGTVTLGNATLNLNVGFNPNNGDSFTIINNGGLSPVSGTFNQLPEGALISVGGSSFQISYVGGTNNDVVLTRKIQEAASFVVTTASDVVDPFDNLTSLREAIALANSNPDLNTITFAAGLDGQPIVVSAGEFVITSALNITGSGTAKTIIDAQSNSRIMKIEDLGQSISVTLSGLTFQNGHAVLPSTNPTVYDGAGGAILTEDQVTLTVSNSIFQANASDANGGAIYNLGILNISDATFTSNNTDESNQTFAEGGAIFNSAGATLTVSASNFTSNFASEDGGAILNDGTATISQSSFTLNTTNDDAGAIDNQSSAGELTIIDSSFTDNSVADVGGAIRISGGTAMITGSTFSGNFATRDSGAIHNDGELTIRNSTLSGNSTNGVGGAIYGHGGSVTLINSTVTLNHAGASGDVNSSGGGIYSDDGTQTTLQNSIVAGNLAGGGAGTPDDLRGTNVNAGSAFNLIGDSATAGGLTNGANGNLIGVDPLLGALANNGGPTLTHALLAGSRAINHGSNALAIGLTTDQRGTGFLRIPDDAVDIGAFEVQPVPASLTITPTGTVTNASPIVFQFQFDNAVSGFTVGDVAVTNGTAGALTNLGGGNYSLAITPTSDGAVTVSVAADATAGGNNATSASVTSDRSSPQLTITPDGTVSNSANLTFTFQFSEAVTGFSAADIDVTNGTKGVFAEVDGDTYTLVVTPNADGAVTVAVSAGAASDAALNGSSAATATITSDRTAPVFSTLASQTVAENTSTVTTVVATDAHGPVTYLLQGGLDVSKFSIDTNTGALQFIEAPDYEVPTDSDADRIYQVTVRATDGLGQTRDLGLVITVAELNDNTPEITSSSEFTVVENQITVANIVATDADLPTQSISYSITGGIDANKFTISAGGTLTFVSAPDFENPSDSGADNTYQVTVTATDDVDPTRSTSQSLTITVLNSNEAPTDIGLVPATLDEQQPVGTTVGTLTTTDPDSNQSFTYSLVSGDGSTDNAKFQIVGNVLKTNAVLSFNTQSTYSVRVRSSDAGELSTEKVFTIQLNQVAISLLDLGGPAVTWVKRQPPVTVLPQITVNNSLSLAGGTLTISMTTVGTKRKALDLLVVPPIAFGASNTVSRTPTLSTFTVQLGADDTAAEIQALLRGIQFSTKGKGLKLTTRSLQVTLTDNDGHSTQVTQTINVRKKP